MSRLARDVAAFAQVWNSIDPGDRVELERELQLLSRLVGAWLDELPTEVTDAALELGAAAAIEIPLGGVDKAKQALRKGWPERAEMLLGLLEKPPEAASYDETLEELVKLRGLLPAEAWEVD